MKRIFGTGLLVLLLGQMWMVAGQQASAKSASAMTDVFPPAAALKVGASAPDFTLEDEQGRQVRLSAPDVNTPTLVYFFRGWWCPFCARQLAEMRTLLRPRDKVRVLAVSIDGHEQTKGLLEKIAADGKGQLGFPVLADPGAKVINLYGVQDHRYDGKSYDDGKIQLSGIPYDSFYLIDTNGKIVWSHLSQDYKIHPSNAAIRAEIDKLKK